MRTTSPHARLTALVLAVALLITLTTPAQAEADVLTAIAIASLVVSGVILIAYLVIANVSDARRADEGRIVWVALAVPAPVETP